MKRKSILVVLMSVIMIFSLVACTQKPTEDPTEDPTPTDPNTSTVEPCEDNEHGCGIDVATNNIDPESVPLDVIRFDEAVDKLDGTALLMFSFVDCPWCKVSLPYITEISKNYPDISTYYVDVSRDERVDGNSTYDILFERFKPWLTEELGEDVEKIFIPYFVWVKDGEIVATHTGTIDDSLEMTPDQDTQFRDLITANYEKLK